MKTGHKIAIILIAAVLALGSAVASVLGPGIYLAYRGQRLRTRLLCETDHRALLEACRQLSGQAMSGGLEPRSYRVRRKPDPAVAQFPEVIRTLRPEYVAIDGIDGKVKVSMSSGWDSFGLYAYPKDFTKHYHFEHRDRELLDGLWYYDEFYRHDANGQWAKKVTALLKQRESANHRDPVR